MRQFRFNAEKNKQLIRERGISFDDVIRVMEEGGVLWTGEHPNKVAYPSQRLFVVDVNGYAFVPFVFDDEVIVLKTIFPGREWTKHLLKKGDSYGR